MRRQRKNPQLKGMEDSTLKELNEMELSKLTDIEFKIMVIRMLKEHNDNYREIQISYGELTVNCTSVKKDI